MNTHTHTPMNTKKKKQASLFSDGKSNAKTSKNLRDTIILYLTPYKFMGKNMCPSASRGCAESCLYTAGYANVYKTINEARERRTHLFLENRKEFLLRLVNEINSAAKKAKGELAVRVNGTSDMAIVHMLTEYAKVNRIEIRENVIFYDYTKVIKRAGSFITASGHRYVTTFSRSEENEKLVLQHLANGGIVSVVFDELPEYWNGFKVYDGDERDDLMLDLIGPAVIGLRAKGKAKKDSTGFVVIS